MNNRAQISTLKYFLPLLAFLGLYLGSGLFLTFKGLPNAFYQFPATSSAFAGFLLALLISFRDVDACIKTFVKGIGNETVVLMCLIFLLAGAFSAVSKAMGGVDATVNMGLWILPNTLILPGLFLISCFISLSMGTSMGTLSTVVPIAIGIATQSDLDISMTLGAVIGGSMFGDNLSIISDTTIAATSTQGCEMSDKMKANLKIAIPAAIVTFVLLLLFGKAGSAGQNYDFSFLKTLPYLAVLVLAVLGFNVVTVLVTGIIFASTVGLYTETFDILTVGKSIHTGFLDMTEVIFLTFFLSGLAFLAVEKGSIQFLLDKITQIIKKKRYAELSIASIVSLADICIANNTIAIIVTGDMVKQISTRFRISPARAASLVDIFSCVWQGILPYGAQLLLVGALASTSTFDIIPFIWYPLVLGVYAIFDMFFLNRFGRHEAHSS